MELMVLRLGFEALTGATTAQNLVLVVEHDNQRLDRLCTSPLFSRRHPVQLSPSFQRSTTLGGGEEVVGIMGP
ncbi:hypothetical protein Tco_0512482 [Tanacetum coccineum]